HASPQRRSPRTRREPKGGESKGSEKGRHQDGPFCIRWVGARPLKRCARRFRLRLRYLRSPFNLAQTGSLATQTAEVEELGAANLVGADLLDLVDDLGVVGEDALDALAEAHLANGEGALGALAAGDNHALERLQTLLVAFLDSYLHANLIAGAEVREVCALELVGQLLHNRMDCHDAFLA